MFAALSTVTSILVPALIVPSEEHVIVVPLTKQVAALLSSVTERVPPWCELTVNVVLAVQY